MLSEEDDAVFQVPDDDYGHLFGAEDAEEQEPLPCAPVPKEQLTIAPKVPGTCKACDVEMAKYVILLCRHFGLCEDCADRYRDTWSRCMGCGAHHLITLDILFT